MKWPIYPKYKDSGVDWLGEVPERWSLRRLRFLCKFNPSKSEVSLPAMTIVSFLPMEAVGEEGDLSLREAILQDIYNGYTYFRDQDVLVAKITPCFENGKGALASELMNGLGFGTTEFHVLRPCDQIIPKFLYYLTKTAAFRLIGEASMTGAAGQKRVPQSFIADFPCVFPSIAMQQDIVTVLDVQLNQIQILIVEQEKLISLLQEKRQTVISHAVTKGLNPDAPMKDSGVEWLGMVPTHWGYRKLGYCMSMSGGSTPSKDNTSYWGGSIPWVSPKDMKKRSISDSEDHITESALKGTGLRLYEPPVVLIVIRGMILTHSFPVAITENPVTVNQDMKAIQGNPELLNEYLAFILEGISSFILANVDDSAHGTKCIRADFWKSIGIFIPDMSEQSAICEYLHEQTEKIDELLLQIQHSIEVVRERRTALISAAVTGKIDVRGLTASEPA